MRAHIHALSKHWGITPQISTTAGLSQTEAKNSEFSIVSHIIGTQVLELSSAAFKEHFSRKLKLKVELRFEMRRLDAERGHHQHDLIIGPNAHHCFLSNVYLC